MKLKKKTELFITAEIGLNHNNDYSKTIKLINLAIKAGADAVKFQLFKTESLYSKKTKAFNYLKKYETNYSFYKKILQYCNRKKILCYASPFDKHSIKFLKNCNNKIYKIASSEIDKLEHLEMISKLKKKIIISTGMANEYDIKKIVNVCKKNGNNDIVLMHCVSQYPQPVEHGNLNKIDTLKKFGYEIGFSDHSENNISAIVAASKGVSYFEKHITFSNKQKGPDHFYACEIKNFEDYIKSIKLAKKSLGTSHLVYDPKIIFHTRRQSYYSKRAINIGEKLLLKDICLKNTLEGINKNKINKFLNKTIKKKIKKNKAILETYF
jgi:N,N'-diacetyllegionaminate synthase